MKTLACEDRHVAGALSWAIIAFHTSLQDDAATIQIIRVHVDMMMRRFCVLRGRAAPSPQGCSRLQRDPSQHLQKSSNMICSGTPWQYENLRLPKVASVAAQDGKKLRISAISNRSVSWKHIRGSGQNGQIAYAAGGLSSSW